jgi:hypothetical protein
VHAAHAVASTAAVGTFAVPMAIGALFGAFVSSWRTLASLLSEGDVDWVERIRLGVLFVCAYYPLYRLLRESQAASTWYAFFGGAFVMYALVLVFRLLHGPSSTHVEQTSADT